VTAWRLLLACKGAGYERLYSGFDTHADGLLLGAIAALIDWPTGLLAVVRRFALVPLLVLVAVFVLLRIDSTPAQSVGLTVTAAASAWLVLAAGGPGRLSRTLSWPPLVWLGRISYGLYLWHFPVFILMRSKVPGPAVLGLVALSLALAVFSYVVIERPFLRLKTRFEPQAAQRPTEAVIRIA
jgi:peptidoglycan/LPS O-acetylase OafA/YrhL